MSISAAAYERFVAQGVGQEFPWVRLRGQIYLGGEEFLKRLERRLPARPVRGVARGQLQPTRPNAQAIEAAVARCYGVPVANVLDRSNANARKAVVYLLRRVANLPLARVAKRAGISLPRVSQIQAAIERGELDQPLKDLLRMYAVKA